MLRFTVFCCVIVTVIAQDFIDPLEEFFTVEEKERVKNASELACTKIDVGDEKLKGCYECYVCDNSFAISQRARKKQVEFKLQYYKDGKCEDMRVCCFLQADSTFRANENCGFYNPDGFPTVSRDRLRQVLPGEYPWRAWVYSKTDPKKPLCGAIFINVEPSALLTPAKCVEEDDSENLMVRFNRNPPNGIEPTESYDVTSIVLHEYFRTETRYNDIAIITISPKPEMPLPSWVKPVCRSAKKPPFASACITISDGDNYINTIIPQQSKCVEGEFPLDDSFVCTVTERNDYEPEFGGGLICPKTIENNNIIYNLYGITLYQSGDSGVTVHANTTHFLNWIDNKLIEMTN